MHVIGVRHTKFEGRLELPKEIRHPDYLNAIKHARCLGEEELNIYPCNICSGLHVGHDPQSKTLKRRHVQRQLQSIVKRLQLLDIEKHRLELQREALVGETPRYDSEDLATIEETNGQKVMRIFRNSVLVVWALASLAWLCGGCRNGNSKSNQSDLRSILESGQRTLPQSSADSSPDLLESQSKQMVGPRGIDCGRVLVGGDPTMATKCALKAQSSKKPFRVRYDLQGIDSSVAVSIVQTPAGSVGVLQYDSDPLGGGGRAHENVYPKRCPEPVHLWVNPSGRINCFQKESSPPRDAMSPNAEPY